MYAQGELIREGAGFPAGCPGFHRNGVDLHNDELFM